MLGDRYTLGEKLGEGGMGTVYKGYDSITGLAVAIKILKSDIGRGDMLERFLREGEALRKLNHPNIVKLLDTVKTDKNHALIMELVSGGSLGSILEQGRPLKITRILEIALDLADALTRAHRLNIIHRDIKPDNILLADDGMPRLTDFGVASVVGSSITQSGMIIGTIAYLSPEQLGESEANPLSDIWSLGVTLYEMLTGRRPFQGNSYSVMISIMNDSPGDLEELRPDAPIALVDLIYRMLAKNPAERIPSIRLVGAELEAILTNNDFSTSRSIILPPRAVHNTVFVNTPADTTRHNLPHQTTPFVGRENELQTLQGLLANPQISLVTIVAQGGMGKTRLSLQAGQTQLLNYPQGVYFIELAPLTSPDEIPMTVAETLAYPFQRDGSTPQQQLVNYFREKEQFLIFDNFEHIIEGRSFIQAILKDAPKIKILVTSRERLNLSGETIFQLEGMDFPDWESPEDALNYAAMRLFIESAQRVRPDFELNSQDLPYAARICKLVQGLPLALVLAGTWLELLSVQEIASEIATSIDFLESNLHDIPERQRSMRAVFEYSWQLLTDAEQATFAQLSIFRGGITREAAQAVTDANLRTLQALVNKSILRRDNETGRYEIHELLRQYAQEQLEQNGLLQTVQQKHAEYFASFLLARDIDIKGRRQLPAIHEIERDFENIKTAWRYACENQEETIIDKMLETVYWFCIFRSRNAEGLDLFHSARQVWQASDENSSLLAGRLEVRCPKVINQPASSYELGLEIAIKQNNPLEIAFCKRQLGHWQSHSQLMHDSGIRLFRESLEGFQTLDDKFYTAVVLDDLGWSHNLIALHDEQIRLVEQSLLLRRQIGDTIGVANSLRALGGAHGGFGSGKIEPMYDWQEALELAIEIGDKNSMAWNNALLAAYWAFIGEFEKAKSYRLEALRIAKDINANVIRGITLLLEALEEIILREDYARAEQLNQEAVPANSSFDVRMLFSLTNMILIGVAKNDPSQVVEAGKYFAANSIAWDHPVIAIILFVNIAIYTRDEDYEKAAELIGRICNEELRIYKLVKDWGWFQRTQAHQKEMLGEEAYNRAIEKGKHLDLPATIKEIYESLR